MLMDAVFGGENFRNEVIWRRTGSHNSPRRCGPIHDVLLFYTRTSNYVFRRVYRPYLKGHVESYFKKSDTRGKYWTNALTGKGTRKGLSGLPWRQYNPTLVGRHWAIPGGIVEELGIDPESPPQRKLDLLDAAGFIDHPPPNSGAMPTYRQYLKDSPGTPIQDIWSYQPHTRGTLFGTQEGIDEDIRWLVSQGDPERLGYETQKPEGLLERIIRASSNEGDLVLDPFCGCGTAVVVAHKLKRQWIGIDITHLAANVIRARLDDTFGEGVREQYRERLFPETVYDAEALAMKDKWEFQLWALGKIPHARPSDKKGADRGIDGVLYFHDETAKGGKTKQIIFSVKAGQVTVSHVRDLRGVVEREGAQIGVLVSLKEPTGPMRTEAASAGFYVAPLPSEPKFPRIQLITVAELFEGKRISYPYTRGIETTYKRAPKHNPGDGAEQMKLIDGHT
jgi:site-specific DNA-methyltransferase (adenine-specific)